MAVVSSEVTARRVEIEGVQILRLDPRAPWRRARRHWTAVSGSPQSAAALDRAPAEHTPARHLRSLPLARRFNRLLTTLDYYRLGIRELRNHRPAIVHCNDYNTMWIGAAARVLTGATVVYDSHELWPDRNLRPEPRGWLVVCEAAFVRLAHTTITTSPGYARVLAHRYRIPEPLVVRNIPDVPQTALAEPEGDNQPIVVYAGAITLNRGLEQTIGALSHAPEIRLRIIGPVRSAYGRELEAVASAAGVLDRVELRPPVAPGEVVNELEPAHAGVALIQPVCLSYELSLPNKLFEYIHAGLPVLVSDLPVLGAIVRDEEIGIAVPPTNLQAIAAGLRELVSHQGQMRFRPAAREAGKRWTWSAERGTLERAYEGAR